MEDHPRIRGEKVLVLVIVFVLVGSPPHTRGKGKCQCILSAVTRITPAYAGKS